MVASGPLAGKVALVTGSSRGIGKAIARELALNGASIAVCARSQQSTEDFPGSIGETVDEIRRAGGNAIAVPTDVTNDDDLARAVETTVSELGGIDILVNNAAAWGIAGTFLDSDVSELELFFRTNVRAAYKLIQLAVPHMRSGSAIVNLSTFGASIPPPPSPNDPPFAPGGPGLAYRTSKAALDRLGTGIATELAALNIGVIIVRPFVTLTERLSLRRDRDLSAADPPELTGKAVAFLVRDPMRYTGQILSVREVVKENNL